MKAASLDLVYQVLLRLVVFSLIHVANRRFAVVLDDYRRVRITNLVICRQKLCLNQIR